MGVICLLLVSGFSIKILYRMGVDVNSIYVLRIFANMLNIPSKIIAGDTVTWLTDDLMGLDPLTGLSTTYTSDQYVLSWSLRGAVALSLTAVASSGTGYKTTITSVQSATLTAGNYFWQAFVTKAGNRVTIGSGQTQIISNLAVGTGVYDGRMEVEKMLDAVTAAIQARLTGGAVLRYEIKGRDLERDPIPDLILLRDRLKVEVARAKAADKIAQGLGDPRRLFVRFR